MATPGDERDLRTQYTKWMAEQGGDPASPPTPAATVIVLRDGDSGLETLMMHRNSKIAFGGAWVFPGGKLDPEDYDADNPDDVLLASRNAAVREAHEEAGVNIDHDSLVVHSHWLPPSTAPIRFATWFFVAPATDEDVVVDQGEITEHAWMRPDDAAAKQAAGEIELAPPTWVTLHHLAAHDTVASACAAFQTAEVPFYATHLGRVDGNPTLMWTGDAGYDTSDTSVPGDRHRLTLRPGDWLYERDF